MMWLLQAKEFLAGLLSMSEWESWASQHDPNDWPDASHMLRPILAEDFGSMLCGQLTPLCVNEWRTATAAQGFLYKDACKVFSCPVSLHRCHATATEASSTSMLARYVSALYCYVYVRRFKTAFCVLDRNSLQEQHALSPLCVDT